LITDTEIRTLVSFSALRLGLAARRKETLPVLFIGPPGIN